MTALPQKPDKLEAAIARNMASASSVAGRTKRSAVRLAIAQAMGDGTLKDGDFLPPEKRLAEILGVSLGTVQAALQQLQQRGEIVRRSGYGSRVVKDGTFSPAIWHFRFVDRTDGRRLAFGDERIAIDTVPAGPPPCPWADFLGESDRYVRIRRLMKMSNGARVAAEMYLLPTTAPRLLRIDPGELNAVNIRTYLQEEFGVVTARASTRVQCVKLDARLAGLLNCAAGDDALELHARAVAHDETPVYYQRIHAPADDCALAF